MALFDELSWWDQFSGKRLIPKVLLRDQSGKPYCGALQIEGTGFGYPVVDGILRATPELAQKYHDWIELSDLKPPKSFGAQKGDTVKSFGFQWTWDEHARTQEDLEWRTAGRFKIDPGNFKGKLILDAGCGAGDQTRFFLDHRAKVVSIDLSDAINVVYRKVKQTTKWVGIQGDIIHIPFEDDTFDLVYCEGVIHHTKDSMETVKELARVVKRGGEVAATHYALPQKWRHKIRHEIMQKRRNKLSRMNPYRLLAWTGVLAIMSEVPIIGHILKKSGIVTHNPRMPDFKSTWCCTYDTFGSHSFQRYVSDDVFRSYWNMAGEFQEIYCSKEEPIVYLRKL